jgi:(4S)-4-hydroxy-5-phosphonooxypentane-2,3-dione isomerase
MVLIVNIKVSKDRIEDFIAATRENMGHSRAEPGISRFELLQDDADPSRFVLVEGYRDAAAQARHKETAHYLKWKELAEPMMAEPRSRALYSEIEP